MPEENQHARDSAELRRLCSERDQLRAELDASKFCANVADDLRAELALSRAAYESAEDDHTKACAELAAAKETIMRYETTAENCDLLRAELAALKAQEPVAWMLKNEKGRIEEILPYMPWASDMQPYWPEPFPLYAAPVAKQVVMPDVTAAAKALCKHHAELCNVNADDQWNVYSQDFIADAEVVLANSRLNAADHAEGGV